MKNKVNIFLLISVVLAVGIFTLAVADVRIEYFENYGVNFRRNVKTIAEKLNINMPQQMEEFVNQTPPPMTEEEQEELAEDIKKETEANSEAEKLPVQSKKSFSGDAIIVPFKNAYAAAYANFNSQLLCASDTRLVCYKMDGTEEWSAELQLSNPMLKVSDKYILAADEGSTKLYLFENDKKLWEQNLDSAIISVDVSANGDAVIVTDKAHYKGGVTVINKKGETVYQWNSGNHEVMDADISATSRTLAVLLLNTDNGTDSQIQFFDIKKENSYETVDVADSIIFDIEFCEEILNAVADNRLIGFKVSGSESWKKEFDGKILNRYKMEDSGYKVCVFDNNNASQISVITGKGSERSSIDTRDLPEKIDICDGYILYNSQRTLTLMPISGKKPRIYNCTNDIYDLFLFNSKSLAVVYNSSIGFINL